MTRVVTAGETMALLDLCGAGDALIGVDDLLERGVEGVVVRTAGSALVACGDERIEVEPAGREAVVDEVRDL